LEADSSTSFLGQHRRVRGKAPNRNVDHTFLTSIVDQRGVLRVQYLGVRFGPEEFRRDLLSLLQE
jgi:protein SCO1/2